MKPCWRGSWEELYSTPIIFAVVSPASGGGDNEKKKSAANINDLQYIIGGTAKVDFFVGIKLVVKIDFKIPSLAPRIVQLVAAKGRTVK